MLQHYQQWLTAFCQRMAEGGLPYYSSASQHTRVAALHHHFAATKQWLSQYVEDGIFEALAWRYADQVRLKHWDINHYGSGFAKVLNVQQRPGVPWQAAAELATLEYALHQAYYLEQSAEHLSLEALAHEGNLMPAITFLLAEHPYTICASNSPWQHSHQAQVVSGQPVQLVLSKNKETA